MNTQQTNVRFFHIRPKEVVGWERPDGAMGEGLNADERPILGSALPKGGATVMVKEDKADPGRLLIGVAFCSKHDMFSRKVGRTRAKRAAWLSAPVDELPWHLEEVSREVVGHILKVPRGQRKDHHLYNMDWTFAKKFFEPKREVVADVQ